MPNFSTVLTAVLTADNHLDRSQRRLNLLQQTPLVRFSSVRSLMFRRQARINGRRNRLQGVKARLFDSE